MCVCVTLVPWQLAGTSPGPCWGSFATSIFANNGGFQVGADETTTVARLDRVTSWAFVEGRDRSFDGGSRAFHRRFLGRVGLGPGSGLGTTFPVDLPFKDELPRKELFISSEEQTSVFSA